MFFVQLERGGIMTKQKKKRRLSARMKKTIRYTVGGLLLVTALVVALIPQKGIEASGEEPRVTVSDSESSIPVIDDKDTVYTTGDGMFQFAYVEKGSGGDKVAVIVGYDYERSLEGGELTIPNTVDAYVKYTHAQGTSGGYVAVGKSGNILYYPVYHEVEKEVGKDEDGNPIVEVVKEILRYDPCLYSTYTSWYYTDDGNVREPKDYYYEDSSAPEGYSPTLLEIYQRIQNASVAYISSQHVVKNEDGEWVLDPTPNTGIFSKATNIQILKTGSNLLGIGNYAFYECASLRGIDLSDGANTIGNYAFANCVNLEYANFPINSSVKALGDHVFYNCRSLKEFDMPVAVQKVGDSAFEGCTGLVDLNLMPQSKNVLLTTLGDNVFKNCTKLSKLELPDTYNEDFDISWIEGCSSLAYIRVPNLSQRFVAKGSFGFAELMEQLPEEFYFEGASDSKIHDISKTNSFAFKYLDEEIYEKVVVASGTAGTGQTVFRINDKNELIYFYMDKTVAEVVLPGKIGPYEITRIGSTSFNGNHHIKKISIPDSIVAIEDNAFSGCHCLRDVIFEDASKIEKIGAGAFNTQVVDPIIDGCKLDDKPVLTFTGVAEPGSVPFEYAMNPANNINRGSQQTSFITFYTGWPSNLTIRYNANTDKNELIDYPSNMEELGTKYTMANYPYITQECENAASKAYANYKSGAPMSQDEKDIIGAALNVRIPAGVESVKEGLFSGKTSDGTEIGIPNTSIETITLDGCSSITPYMFSGCTNLIGAYIGEKTQVLGDYAFEGCAKLADVDVASGLNTYGIRPFKGCKILQEVSFIDNPNFTCKDAIVYATVNGEKTKLLEVLESRGVSYGTGAITAAELEGITEIAKEAAMDCDGILSVDFSKSKIKEIPESCFEGTDGLYSIILPDTCRNINKKAFKDSNVRYLEIPTSVGFIDNSAFENDKQIITFYCELDSPAAVYADNYENIVVSEKAVIFKVTFADEDGTVLDTVYVNAGADATTHVIPKKEGYVFKAWLPAPVGVTADMTTYATYSESNVTYLVRFIDYDDKVLSEQYVKEGGTPVTPVSPEREGYKFTGWRPSYENITKDTDVYAQYEKIVDEDEDKKEEGKDDSDKDKDDKDDKDNSSDKDNNGGGNNNNTTLYTLTVVNGSGGGSYVAGATVILLADNPPAGKVFDKWTTDTEGVTFSGSTVAATTMTMPAKNATVTATYKNSASGSGSSGNNSGSNNNANNGSGSSSNTEVSVDKDGWSNGQFSATVSGSSDNFVLKITDSAYAKKEIEAALETEYGSLNDLKYFCMDISLYDSTGTKKVENANDLRVTITLPIPNDLVKYAGNNRIAYVSNGKLIPLSPKFTTINGVPCMTFVATHFSPYTIYVDTTNLSAGSIIDTTPKTGDGISPKWFVCIGMAALAIFLFVKKDKKRVVVK
ncbi:MAG: hypothetical protein E7288_00455 [Lachnospiraceae bacterium]|nr:hypothetical protein [Lachnospiraceae bacterium]